MSEQEDDERQDDEDVRVSYGLSGWIPQQVEVWAGYLIAVCGLLAALSLAGGIFGGLEASKPAADDFGGSRDNAELAAWIAVGVVTAIWWVVVAVVLGLLGTISENLRKLLDRGGTQ